MDRRREKHMRILANELEPSIEAQIAWFHHMQGKQPIRYLPECNMWEVFRYKDVQQVFFDHATFSSASTWPEALPALLGKSDPPQHRQLRSLVSKAFTPRRIEQLTPQLIHIIDELLAPAFARGKMDVVSEFSRPFTLHVIAEMLGLPPEDQEHFFRWSYQLFREAMGFSNPDNSEPFQYFSDLLDKRKCKPQNDLMSGLLVAEENGVHLTREAIINLCLEMMMAGNITTTTVINSVIQRLCLHPEIYQDLRDDPSLISGAIEETLRYDHSWPMSPRAVRAIASKFTDGGSKALHNDEYFQSSPAAPEMECGYPMPINIWRRARHDTVLGGQQIKAGQDVAVYVSAANFDEAYFSHSEQFDIRRSPNPHLTFISGVHSCLGAPLARLEGRLALERIVARFSEIRLDPEKLPQYMGQMGPLEFTQSLDILLTKASSPTR